MGYNEAVILSSWCPDESTFPVAMRTLAAVKEFYSDCDIYVGVNPPVYYPWIEALRSLGPNVHIEVVPDNLAVNSDASAFIHAVNAYRKTGKLYSAVFIGHTKSVDSKLSHELDLVINKFWSQRQSHREIMNIHEDIGAVFPYSTLVDIHDHSYRLKDCIGAPYTQIPFMATMSFMTMDGDIFHKFAHALPDEFFTKNLVDELKYDRWFVERDVSFVPSFYGKVPFPLRIHSHADKMVFGLECYNEAIQKWSKSNGDLWVPRFKHEIAVEKEFKYCPLLLRINAINLSNADIPDDLPPIRGTLPAAPFSPPPLNAPPVSPPHMVPITYDPRNSIQSSSPPTPNPSPPVDKKKKRLPVQFYDFLRPEATTSEEGPIQPENPENQPGPLLRIYNKNPKFYDEITDKGHATHYYIQEYYDEFFKQYQNVPFKMLEIGTYKGGSSLLWRTAFPNGVFYSCDINPLVPPSEWGGPNWQIFVQDAYTEAGVKFMHNACGMLDVIIDDGPHTEESQMFALENYYDLILPGGSLIIEDVPSMPLAILMKTKYPECEIIDLRTKHPEIYINDNILVIRKKPYYETPPQG